MSRRASRYPSTYHVAQSEKTGRWFVYRANVGGDVFFVEEYETKMAADWRVAELKKREEINRFADQVLDDVGV